MPSSNHKNVTPPDDRDGFSIATVARRYDVSKNLIRREIARGRLRAVRVARRVVLLRADVEAWINSTEMEMADPTRLLQA
jgi:excisionase family DNA binding protein